MVNELYTLSQSMEKAGIKVGDQHRQLKELRKVTDKAPCLRIEFDKDGKVAHIGTIDADLASSLRKFEPNLGSSFPAFNMSPLYGADKSAKWSDGVLGKLEKCLHRVPAQLKEIADKCGADCKTSVYSLLSILPTVTLDSFKSSLDEYCKAHVDTDKFLESVYASDADVQVILDLHDWQSFGCPVAHEKSVAWMNDVLLKSEKPPESAQRELGNENDVKDAFGDAFVSVREPMPEVKLPGKVGGVKLRAMFHDHQCQYRYGMIDDGSYPVSRENRGKIANALRWLKEPEREGGTWGMVSLDEILFAYPETLPKVPPKFARLLGASVTDAASEKFSSIASDVIKTLRGLPPEKRHEAVRIFAIRKMDKARSKVVFYRNYTTARIIEAAEAWQKGCANIPAIHFRACPEKMVKNEKQAPETIMCETPLPLRTAFIANAVWKMDGSSAGEVQRIKPYQGIELLLDRQHSGMEAELLAVLLANSFGLVSFLGNLLHGKDKNGYAGVVPSKLRRNNFVYLFPLLGLLLYKQNCMKENYMENIPYLLGQMLKVSDELHTLYCQVVRKGEVPPQLAGNSLFVTALETPERALAQLGQRVNPYLSWAKQYRTKNIAAEGAESWRASWYLNLYSKNATALQSAICGERHDRFNDLEKAQLFIGYLADFPKKTEAQQTQVTGGQS
jgi:hypothetical protein